MRYAPGEKPEQDLIPYNKNGIFGLCDTEGQIRIEPAYSYMSFHKPRLGGYLMQKGDKYGLIGKKLKAVIAPVSDDAIAAGEFLVAETGNELIYGPLMPDPGAYPERIKYSREEVMELF